MSGVAYTEMVTAMRQTFKSGITRPISWRMNQLKAMRELLTNESEALQDALYKDLHKHSLESLAYEIHYVRNELQGMMNNLSSWMKKEKVKGTMLTMTDTAYIQREPLGVTLILGAWNYPVQLILSPLLGAIAGGNCAVLKPSELSHHTAKLIEELIPKYFDNDCFKVVNGGIPETTELLKERFDLIFYTGSGAVGKIILQAAAKYLTPCVMELGGKSPCYVDDSADFDVAARRILWGKLVNCGQTCIAPDYILCTKQTQDVLVEKMKTVLEEFYKEDAKSGSYGRIVNKTHFLRIKELMEGNTVAIGGETDEEELYISPTVLTDVSPAALIMKYEVFGPLLPVVVIDGINEAIEFINEREKPLAMYVFSPKKAVLNRMLNECSAGSICTNDCLMQNALDTLPFGGVGASGYGQYHGKHSFNVFTNPKSVMLKYPGMESVNNLRYPPYDDKKTGWLEYLGRVNPAGGLFSWIGLGGN